MEKITFLVCENFRKEFEITIKNIDEDVEIITFPSFCNLDKNEELFEIKDKFLENRNLVVFCCDFCNIIRKISKKYQSKVKIYKFENCFYMFGKTKIEKYINEGSYLLTPGWLVNWKKNLSVYGFNKEIARKFFKESIKKIVFLKTYDEKDIENYLKEFSEFLDLPYVIENIDLDYFQLLILKALKEVKDEQKIKQLLMEKSNYMAAFNFLSTISNVQSEGELIKNIVDQIRILLSPKNIEFLPYNGEDILEGEDYKINEENMEIILKIKFGDEIFGFLTVSQFLFSQYFDSYANFLVSIKDVFGLAISNVRKLEMLLDLAIYDTLTKIYNRNYFELKFSEEVIRSKREGTAFSLIMMDLDNFKEINDKYGHKFGDEILVKVVDVVKKRLRKSDFFFRWGGDEFILLLPNTDINGAEILTNKLRKIINQIEVGGIKVSASFGVIEFKGAEIDKESLFKKLDEALYKAKQLGKNRIFVIK